MHFCGFIEKKIQPTKKGAKHILSHAVPLIFILIVFLTGLIFILV
jgi:hypothetical protein